ncbi:MAG: DnaJ domain-containing protein [Bacteroidales bacterium]|nr:DnaJ domain-containing protein [Bacteroidales bacterium]
MAEQISLEEAMQPDENKTGAVSFAEANQYDISNLFRDTFDTDEVKLPNQFIQQDTGGRTPTQKELKNMELAYQHKMWEELPDHIKSEQIMGKIAGKAIPYLVTAPIAGITYPWLVGYEAVQQAKNIGVPIATGEKGYDPLSDRRLKELFQPLIDNIPATAKEKFPAVPKALRYTAIGMLWNIGKYSSENPRTAIDATATVGEAVFDYFAASGIAKGINLMATPVNPEVTKAYETLGLNKGASSKEVTQKFRDLSKQYHPDVVGTGDEAKIKEINNAVNIIRNSKQGFVNRILDRFNNMMSKAKGKKDPDKIFQLALAEQQAEDTAIIQASIKATENQIPKAMEVQPKVTADPLAIEAKKYDTAEEFVGNKEVFYHGTKNSFTEFDNAKIGSATDTGMWGTGFYFSKDITEAQAYAGEDGVVMETYLDMKNPYIINSKEDIPIIPGGMKNGAKRYSDKFRDYLISKGYDSVIDNTGAGIGSDKQYVVFDKSQIKTKQQLTDIWNQANAQTVNRAIMDIEVKAQTKPEIISRIKAKKLEKLDTFRKFLKLPSMKNMSTEQLSEFEKVLDPYKEGDVFLSPRQLETVDKTDLKGVRTYREARERLAKKTGVSVEELSKIKVSEIDRLRYDTALAEKNPFYKLMVEETHRNLLIGEANALKVESEINELTKKARASRKRSLIDKAIPTDEKVFEYLSSENKSSIIKDMTKEEIKLAEYLQDKFADALDYLIKTEVLKTGRENYITNIRRDFFEATKEDGLIQAFKEIFDQHKLDEQKFNILDQQTDLILPLEKFFQFSLRRTGKIKPSQNVAKAANTYFRTLEKKKALDALMPEIMIYAQSITPNARTATGLEMDQSLKKFIKEWINTKKGRYSRVIAQPGGKLDIGIKAAKAVVSILDLGLNIPVGLAANVGETVATYVTLGKKVMSKGIARSNTAKGKAIAKKYKNFIGKGVFEEISEPSLNLGDKFSMTLLGLFKSSSVRANKISLLGSMTDAEYSTGTISPERLAAIKIDLGRYRVMQGFKSIVGSTTEGGVITQYKTWAVPILRTVSNNIGKIAKGIVEGKVRGTVNSRQVRELLSALEVTIAALFVTSIIKPDDKDKSFSAQLKRKVARESLTIIGALDPSMMLGEPRLVTWAANLGKALKQLVSLEKYKEKGREKELKGVTGLIRELTPRAIKSIVPEKEEDTSVKRSKRTTRSTRTTRTKRNTRSKR